MIAHANYFDSHKTISFKASDSKLFKSILDYGEKLF